MIVGQIMYAASDVSKPSTIHAVNFGLEHGGAAQHRSELSDNFFFLPEIFREIFALRARSVGNAFIQVNRSRLGAGVHGQITSRIQ